MSNRGAKARVALRARKAAKRAKRNKRNGRGLPTPVVAVVALYRPSVRTSSRSLRRPKVDTRRRGVPTLEAPRRPCLFPGRYLCRQFSERRSVERGGVRGPLAPDLALVGGDPPRDGAVLEVVALVASDPHGGAVGRSQLRQLATFPFGALRSWPAPAAPGWRRFDWRRPVKCAGQSGSA